MLRRLLIHGPTVVWGGTILILTSIPTLKPPDLGVSFSDKISHAAVYAVFAALLFRSYSYSLARISRIWTAVLCTGIGFAAVDEYHQRFISGRYAEWLDFAADVLGILLMVLLIRGWHKAVLRSEHV